MFVAKYHNIKETKKLGNRISQLRLEKEFYVDDIAAMTGFARQTITAIEKGSNTDSSHIIEIAKALGVHPRDLFDFPVDIKPRFKLPPNRMHNSLLTLRLNKLCLESDFFKTAKLVSEVLDYLLNEFKIKSDSTKVSVVLKRLVKEGKLQYSKIGRKNSYIRKKK